MLPHQVYSTVINEREQIYVHSVLLGPLISMVFIDHFGLLGALQHSISSQRLAGLALINVGVFLTIGHFQPAAVCSQ